MPLLPVRRSVTVPLDRRHAFDLFTRRIGEWWPLSSNSLGLHHAASCHLEPGIGGRLFERTSEGAESVWGQIAEWSEPSRIVVMWHPARHPGTAQPLEIRFTAVKEGTCVELEHGGWENAGDRAVSLRERYESGWPGVLARYEWMASRRDKQ